MATVIGEDCIVCGACEDECPTTAICLGDGIFVVDPDLCTECVGFFERRKCAEACPVDCCILDPENREAEQTLLERARAIHGQGKGLELDEAASHFRAA